MKGVSGRGGAHGWEHPEDPGCDPFPSIWCTPEMLKLEQRTGSKGARFVSACWGPRSERARRFQALLMALIGLERFQCPGIGVEGHHHSGCSEGTDSSGHFFTRRLQTYPPRMCEELARMIVDTAQRMLRTSEGPLGIFFLRECRPFLRLGHFQRPEIMRWGLIF